MTKIQNITTSPITAIEALSKNPDNEDLELIGFESLVNVSKSLANAIKAGLINENYSFSRVFGYEKNFYYIIECVSKEKVTNYERGIGYVYQKDGKTFLKRIIPIVNGKNAVNCISSSSCGLLSFDCCKDDCVVLYSAIPHSFIESLPMDNSVICCLSQFLPQPVQVQEHSILGRLEDTIQSISLEDQSFIEKIINSISKYTKQIKLKVSKLSLKRTECEIIDLIPTNNIKAKKGSLYYDESDNNLKLYDGESWKVIAFVED